MPRRDIMMSRSVLCISCGVGLQRTPLGMHRHKPLGLRLLMASEDLQDKHKVAEVLDDS